MIRVALVACLAFSWTASVGRAQPAAYVPLGGWQSNVARWESQRASLAAPPLKTPARPVVPGHRPASVELLQDALLRKNSNLLQSDAAKARSRIARRYYGGPQGRNFLNGALAEAVFLQAHPEWNYVGKSNASQHDVYRTSSEGRPPLNGQVKFHARGDAATYAADMQKDFRAHRFFVPDDHVEPLRNLWRRRYDAAIAEGDAAAARQAARNMGRVQPIGTDSAGILAGVKSAARHAAAEARSVYLSLSTAVGMSLGQIGWDYSSGTLNSDQAAYRATKALSLIGTVVAVDFGLRWIKDGALRGTLKGNLIVGAVVLLVETSWNIAELGGVKAFSNPEFYEELGGGVSAVGLGGVAGYYAGLAATAAAAETGPAAPLIGGAAGVVVGTGVGMAAYVGGRYATSAMLQTFWPELYQKHLRDQITAVREGLEHRLATARALD